MPQAKTTGGSDPKKPAAARRTPVKAAAAKPGVAKPASAAAAKPAAAKPAATKSAASRTAAAKPAAGRAAAGRAGAAKTAAAKPGAKRTTTTAAKPKPAARPAAAKTGADSARGDAVAQRLRKLNEKIIEVGREAGESTLANYERALKAIAAGLEKTPAKDEAEWVAHLATSQAKFIRDITDSWAKAARQRLK